MPSRSFATTDLINCTSAVVFDDLSALSISVWARQASFGGNSRGTIMEKAASTTPTNGWALRYGSDVTLGTVMTFNVEYATTNLKASASGFFGGSSYFVGLSWDGSTTAANALFYKNGVLQNPGTLTNGVGARSSDAVESIIIGNSKDGTSNWDSNLAVMHLYNRVLTAAEFTEIASNPGFVTQGLIGFWPLWGGTAPLEYDYSTQGNDGTLTGTTLSTTTHPPVNNLFGPWRDISEYYAMSPTTPVESPVMLAALGAGT